MKICGRITGPSVLSSWIRSICQTVRGYDIDPMPLMERAGLDSKLLNIPDARYPVAGVHRLWQQIIEATGDPLIGLRVGQEIQVSTLHGLGLAMGRWYRAARSPRCWRCLSATAASSPRRCKPVSRMTAPALPSS